jgi:hypothetical protein
MPHVGPMTASDNSRTRIPVRGNRAASSFLGSTQSSSLESRLGRFNSCYRIRFNAV